MVGNAVVERIHYHRAELLSSALSDRRKKVCSGNRPDSRDYEPEELRRSWRKCHLPVVRSAAGLSGRTPSACSGAKAVALDWDTAASWYGKVTSAVEGRPLDKIYRGNQCVGARHSVPRRATGYFTMNVAVASSTIAPDVPVNVIV